MQAELIHKPKKKKWIVIGVIVLIVIVAAINIMVIQTKKNSSTADLKFASVTEKELSNTKLVAGQVVPANMETFYQDPTKGTVKELFVKEGQEVVKGQKLFIYDNPELSIQLRQLEIDKKSAKLRYDQGNEKIASLQDEIKKAKDANATTEVLTPLEAQLQDLQFQQKTTELEIEKNKLQGEDLQNKQNGLTVYSSFAGIVQKATKDTAGQSTGQTAGAQANPVVQIASKDSFVIQGTLTELQKSQIQPTQPITVTAKAVSNQTWKGKITEISEYPSSGDGQSLAVPAGQQTQNISYYNFKATLDSQDGLSPGYHVSIQVDLSTKKMLVVPSSSITEKGNSRFVYVLKNKKLHKQTVTTGIGDGNSTEVLEGLKAGEKVVNNPSTNVYEGLEVKTK